MKIEPLPPIPSPPEHHWRQFRVNVLPALTFLVVLVVVGWLWGRNLANPLIVGQAEGPEASITSPVAGRVAQIHVSLYQEVQVGDVIAVVDASDPMVLSNTISLIQAQMEAVRADAGFGPGDKVRYAQFHMDWMSQRAELASLRAELRFSQLEYDRISKLMKDDIPATNQLDYALSVRDRLQGAVDEKTIGVAAAEKAQQIQQVLGVLSLSEARNRKGVLQLSEVSPTAVVLPRAAQCLLEG